MNRIFLVISIPSFFQVSCVPKDFSFLARGLQVYQHWTVISFAHSMNCGEVNCVGDLHYVLKNAQYHLSTIFTLSLLDSSNNNVVLAASCVFLLIDLL